VYDHEHQSEEDHIVNEENVTLVRGTIERIVSELPGQPVIGSEMIILLANRFSIQLSAELQQEMKDRKQEALDGKDLEGLMRQRSNVDSGGGLAAAEEFDLATEASEVPAMEELDPDYNFPSASGSASSSLSSSSSSQPQSKARAKVKAKSQPQPGLAKFKAPPLRQ
jgi:hypothetical protein